MKPRPSLGLASLLAVLLALVALGALAYARQLAMGDIVTSMRTVGAGGVVWGLYVVMDGLFLSAGVAVMASACVARFSRDREMETVARVAMPVAVTCFLAAALSVMADQGRPLVAIEHLALVARPESPLFWTFTTVAAVGLFGSLVYCVMARRPDLAEYAKQTSFWQPLQRLLAAGYRGSEGERHRRQRSGFWMSALMLFLLAVPLCALAAIFVLRPGRPLDLVVGETIAFIFSSGAAGLGVLVIAAALVGWLAGPRAGLGTGGFSRLGLGLLFVDAFTLLCGVAVEIAGLETAEPAALAFAKAQVGGAYGAWFWGGTGLLMLASFVLWRGAWRTGLRPRTVVFAGALSVAAVFLQRYVLLVAWQTHGLSLPYPPGSYSPSGVELSVAAGIGALSLLLLLPAIRSIPFAPLVFDDRSVVAGRTDLRRTLVVAVWLVLGLAATAFGLILSRRGGTLPFLDPLLPASPVLFIAGLCVLTMAGAVYELLPERAADASPPLSSPPSSLDA